MLNHEIDAFCRGEGHDAWRWLGAHQDGDGFRFVVWAPRAAAVAVVGDFTGWDQAPLPLTRIDDRGFWMVSGPGQPGQLYKLAITGPDGVVRLKADPFARHAELPPGTASRLVGPAPAPRPLPGPRCERPLIYEVHPGSWRKPHGQVPTWRQLADTLVPYVAELGYTHIELMGVAEHPFTGSWGYQITGYFAPTARHGDPAGLRALVEACHQAGLGLIVDWVPAHFVTDEYALARFDGLPLFEHPDPRRGFHPDWHTLIFDYGRPEVRSFLIASALYWLEAFGFDGLRVDAVASMLYLDYSRKDGEWEPNHLGGRENLEAMAFLRAATDAVHARRPDAWLIAEESTAFPGVTRSTAEGGLGFDLKWNLGWMHDTLAYLQTDPLFRSHDHDRLTFPIVYEWSERFVNPLSHDEVVHAKGSLLNKMFGDEWARFAQLRALLVYQHTRPGAVHLFMGSELAPHTEWDHDGELPWSLLEKPAHAGVQRLVHDLARIARRPELAEGGPEGFAWIDCTDRDQSVIAWVRRRGGDAHLVVVLHFTPVHRDAYRIGVPSPAPYDLLLGTDDVRYGGPRTEGRRYHPEPVEWHGQPWSILIELPGSSGLILVPDPGADPSALHELSRRLGVVDRFWDVVGTRHDTTDATRRVLVAALGYPADDQAETTRSLAALDRVPALPTSPEPRPCPSVRRRGFGLCVNLYSVRGRRNLGVGDLTDLARLATWAAAHGADFVGVNPLQITPNRWPAVSPYSPLTRLFRNPVYLDVTAVEAWATCAAAQSLVEQAGARIEALRSADRVDYDEVMAVKVPVLRALFAASPAEAADDSLLEDFATFMALREGHGPSWPGWPESLRDPRSADVASFRAAHSQDVGFHRWLQRELDRQLGAVARAAREAGMAIGLYEDLPVGSASDGFDTWAFPGLFVSGPTLGCPPDPLAPDGQNWALPPLDPHVLRATGYRYWRELIRRALTHAGALRIDHVIGLVRQFWIPAWRPSVEGAYVRFPTDELLAVVAEEANRRGALVVGEDLGTVPPELPPLLRRWGLLSTRVLLFEQDAEGSFPEPAQLGTDALLTAVTHDTPTLRAWWEGRDLELLVRLGSISEAAREQAWSNRTAEHDRLRRRLGRLRRDATWPEVLRAVHRYLGRSRAPLVGVWLDDLAGETTPVNVPGLDQDRFPSWTRRLSMTLEDLVSDDVVADCLRAARRRR